MNGSVVTRPSASHAHTRGSRSRSPTMRCAMHVLPDALLPPTLPFVGHPAACLLFHAAHCCGSSGHAVGAASHASAARIAHTSRITPPHSAEAHEPRAWLDSQLTQNSQCLAPRTQLTVVCHTHQKHAASTYSPLCVLPSHSVAAPQPMLDVVDRALHVEQEIGRLWSCNALGWEGTQR